MVPKALLSRKDWYKIYVSSAYIMRNNRYRRLLSTQVSPQHRFLWSVPALYPITHTWHWIFHTSAPPM